jgi:hypothetical protein
MPGDEPSRSILRLLGGDSQFAAHGHAIRLRIRE